MSESGHTALHARRLTITHTQVRVRLAQRAKKYALTTNRTNSTQTVTEGNTPQADPVEMMPEVHREVFR